VGGAQLAQPARPRQPGPDLDRLFGGRRGLSSPRNAPPRVRACARENFSVLRAAREPGVEPEADAEPVPLEVAGPVAPMPAG
jgi:hypothetical protein